MVYVNAWAVLKSFFSPKATHAVSESDGRPAYKYPRLIHARAKISPKAVLQEPVRLGEVEIEQCKIGRWTYIGGDSRVGSKTTIGAYCSIGQGVRIAPSQHPMDYISTHPFQYDSKLFRGIPGYDFPSKVKRLARKRTTIGHDVWIGADATVIAGITIGTGAVIGASSVVTRNVEPYTIVAGVPARPIRQRFSDDLVARLLKSKWWNWDPSGLAGIAWDKGEEGIAQLEERVRALASDQAKQPGGATSTNDPTVDPAKTEAGHRPSMNPAK